MKTLTQKQNFTIKKRTYVRFLFNYLIGQSSQIRFHHTQKERCKSSGVREEFKMTHFEYPMTPIVLLQIPQFSDEACVPCLSSSYNPEKVLFITSPRRIPFASGYTITIVYDPFGTSPRYPPPPPQETQSFLRETLLDSTIFLFSISMI